MINTVKSKAITFNQVNYREDDFSLLGMAIKYAGLYNREITIVLNK